MVRFFTKIALQQLLDKAPGGLAAYHFLQRHVTTSAIPASRMIAQRLDMLKQYLDALRADGVSRVGDIGTHLDYGAGWHFTVPLSLWKLGIDRQILVDYQRHAREDLVYPVRNILELEEFPIMLGGRQLPATNGAALDEWLRRLGIMYHAPVEGRLPVEDASVGLVTVTHAFEHPPKETLRRAFGEFARILRPGGYFAALTHLSDLYANFDSTLPRFNFLRYSHATWERWFNTRHMSFNRMRPSDFRALIEELPFDIVTWDATKPDLAMIEDVLSMPPHRDFVSYPPDELACPHLFFVLRKK